MSSISPFSSNSEAIFAARFAPASAAPTSTYSSASNGTPEAAPEDTVNINHPEARELLQLGRVAYNEQAGNLTAAQGTALDSQIEQTQTSIAADAQGNGGTLTTAQEQAISQLQNSLSTQIYTTANGNSQVDPPSGVTPANVTPAIPDI